MAVNNDVALEHALIRVPYECLNKTFRNSQKLVEKEISGVVSSIASITNNESTANSIATLDGLLGQLGNLKRKLEDARKEEASAMKKSKLRLKMLKDVEEKKMDRALFQRIRFDRVTVDYLLREGFFDTAISLAEQSSIQELVDISIFTAAKKVVDALKGRDCSVALSWCADNRSKLKKVNSSLEFKLRLQEFIELVRSRKLLEALAYARTYLGPNYETNTQEVQQALTLVAFVDRDGFVYKKLLDESRWDELIQAFQADNYELYCLSPEPALSVYLQAGLASLKTAFCYEQEGRSIDCPVCAPGVGTLAKTVPFAHHVHSSIVCRITGELMDEHNPPMVLPNGYVYSYKALSEQAAKHNGLVHCPRTHEDFQFEEVQKAYLV
eukprot:GILJ01003256.1.p1 GENE.GILJ01003256.1~~GILJ01003256.1.p1  ORF type:complete len:383 (-),score=58.83 GILJ01003256.1:136-1284(-)